MENSKKKVEMCRTVDKKNNRKLVEMVKIVENSTHQIKEDEIAKGYTSRTVTKNVVAPINPNPLEISPAVTNKQPLSKPIGTNQQEQFENSSALLPQSEVLVSTANYPLVNQPSRFDPFTFMSVSVQIVSIIDGERPRYCCNISLRNGSIRYLEVPVNKFTDGKWLYNIPRFAILQGKKGTDMLRAYLNNLVLTYQGIQVLEIHKSGWYESQNQTVYVTPRGVIGNLGLSIRSQFGQDFGTIKTNLNIGNLFDFLQMQNLTPNQPAASILQLYIILSFNYFMFKKAGYPIKFLIFVNGKRGSLKTSLALALTQIENRKNPEFTMKSTSAGLEAGFSKFKDAIMLIDDLAPTLDSNEQRTLHHNLELLVRCFGDGTGKKRNLDFLSHDIKVEQYLAEGGAVITGEYITGVESSLARCVILNLRDGDVDKHLLRKLQDDEKWMTRFLLGFLEYISQNFTKHVSFTKQSCERFRMESQGKFSNLRYAEYEAQFKTALELLIVYGVETGQLKPTQINDLRLSYHAAIVATLTENDNNLVEESPITHLCNAIIFAIESGEYTVLPFENRMEISVDAILFDEQFYYIPQPLIQKMKMDYDKMNGFNANGIFSSSKYLSKLLADHNLIIIHSEGNTKRYSKKISGCGNRRFIILNRQKLQEHIKI